MTQLLTTRDATPRRALVLAGGGIRVAWQTGVVSALADAGLSFAHVDGSSGGTMTAGMLLSGLTPAEMVQRWSSLDVRGFAAIPPPRTFLKGPAQLPALGDPTPLRATVYPHLGIDPECIRDATHRIGTVGTFNVCDFTAKTCVAVPNDQIDWELLIAAVSLPLFLPAVSQAGRTYTDAVWIKDANLLEAVSRGAEELWLVWCIGNSPRYGAGPLEQYVHMIEMSASGGLFAELAVIADIDARRRSGEPVLGSTAPITLHVIKPSTPLPLDPHFLAGRISADTLIDMGHRDACGYLSSMSPDGVPLDDSTTAMAEPQLGVRFRERFSGTLHELGPATLELVTEISDLDACAAGLSAATPIVGHVDLGDGDKTPRRLLLRSARLRRVDATVHYDLTVRLDETDVELTAVRDLPQLLRPKTWRGFRRLRITRTRADASVEEVGDLRLQLPDVAGSVASVDPTGAHDLTSRVKAIQAFARLLVRGSAQGTPKTAPALSRPFPSGAGPGGSPQLSSSNQ